MTSPAAVPACAAEVSAAAWTPAELLHDATPRRYSIEVMPRTADAISDFAALLPRGTEIYIAHIKGTAFQDMLRTAVRVRREGFVPIPHILARAIPDHATLASMIDQYRHEADVTRALVLAGSLDRVMGTFADSNSLLRTGVFDRYGFTELRVAGHPEGSRDIDVDGGMMNANAALQGKQEYADMTDARLAIVSQFAFAAAPIRCWIKALRQQAITMPVHIGLAGPTTLPTLLKYATLCGIGPSIRVLRSHQHRMTHLLTSIAPNELHDDLQVWAGSHPELGVAGFHVFPMGGIRPAAAWIAAARTRDRKRNIR